MAGSSAALSAAELALVTAGKPMLVASNAIKGIPTEPIWDNSAGGAWTGSPNWVDPSYPTTFGLDGHGHLGTRPISGQAPLVSGADAIWRFIGTLDTAKDIDCLFFIGHNLGSIGGGWVVSLQLSDSDTFASNVQVATLSVVAPAAPARLVELALDHTGGGARRYSGYAYFRLILRRVGSTSSFQPQIGELILGRRRHLKRKPLVPYDDQRLASEVSDVVTRTGARVRYVKHVGRRVLSARFMPDDTDELSTIRTWFEETNFGAKSFVYVENPSSSPASTSYLMMLARPELDLPLGGPLHRDWTLEAEELPPFVSAE